MTNTSFARRLRRFRLWRSMTKAELARISGVSGTTLYCLETGVRAPSPRTLTKLADALGLDPEDLTGN